MGSFLHKFLHNSRAKSVGREKLDGLFRADDACAAVPTRARMADAVVGPSPEKASTFGEVLIFSKVAHGCGCYDRSEIRGWTRVVHRHRRLLKVAHR